MDRSTDRPGIRRSSVSTRRTVLSSLGLGIAGAACAQPARAAEWTPKEKANVEVVNGFCAAWSRHDVEKIVSFLADNCTYRPTETQEPVKGREAVKAKIVSLIDRVDKFELLDTFAKGPMVVNERIDSFKGGRAGAWHGVGVFFL